MCFPGEKFMKQETFGQFPLQVNGFKDIHESLEATTMQDEIEAVNKDSATHKSGQEVRHIYTGVYTGRDTGRVWRPPLCRTRLRLSIRTAPLTSQDKR